jgi:hypothetical protein
LDSLHDQSVSAFLTALKEKSGLEPSENEEKLVITGISKAAKTII